jgi:nucleoid-associated protein YgaU
MQMLTGKGRATSVQTGVHDREPRGSNLRLLLLATSFLIVTIGLVLWQPHLPGAPDAQTSQTAASAPLATAAGGSAVSNDPLAAALRRQAAVMEAAERAGRERQQQQEAQTVTRAQMPLLTVSFTPIERMTSLAILEELRQPLRLINVGVPKRDLPQLADDVLKLLSPVQAEAPEALKEMLVEAIRQRQSDAYIRVLLTTGAERGTFPIPPTLRTTDGRFDAYSLLRAMAQTAGNPVPVMPDDVQTSGTQKIVPGDSLARMALRYYGQPLKYDIILAANPQIDPLNPVLTPGDVIQMPKP